MGDAPTSEVRGVFYPGKSIIFCCFRHEGMRTSQSVVVLFSSWKNLNVVFFSGGDASTSEGRDVFSFLDIFNYGCFSSGGDSSTSELRDVLCSLNIFNFGCFIQEGIRPRQCVEMFYLP